jgi:hypothetical protein
VFKSIGEYMMDGLSIGMENASDDVMGTVSGIVKNVNSSFDFGTANVDFASSGLGMSSAGIINSVASSAQSENGGNFTINLMFPNGDKFATYYLPSFINVAKANGTPIVNPA